MTAAPRFDRRYDAIVVGARCAGAATAMLLARGGMRVLAIDKGKYGSDALSTHALMRGAVHQLHRWGVLEAVKASGVPPVRSSTFYYGDETIRVPIESRAGVDALYAPRRTVLDALLVDEARRAGAQIEHQVKLESLHRRGTRVTGVTVTSRGAGGRGPLQRHRIEAPIVIGADGRQSRVAQLAGLEKYRHGRAAACGIFTYWPDLALDDFHWHCSESAMVSAIPTNDGAGCICVSLPGDAFRGFVGFGVEAGFRAVVGRIAPQLFATMGVARRPPAFRRFAGAAGFYRQSWGRGVALVGDAGYFRDPLTAHGITDAFRDAELLARAVLRGGEAALARYQGTRDELTRDLFEVTERIASFDGTLDALKRDHLLLSKSMRAENAAIAAFDTDNAIAA
jgi:flavin-dependent dehydrogenase